MNGHERLVIRKSACCGRDVLEHETHEEWAAAEVAMHGPPSKKVQDMVARMKADARRKAAAELGENE